METRSAMSTDSAAENSAAETALQRSSENVSDPPPRVEVEPTAETVASDRNAEVRDGDETVSSGDATVSEGLVAEEPQDEAVPARGPGVGLEELLTRRQRNRRLKGRLARPEPASTGDGQRTRSRPSSVCCYWTPGCAAVCRRETSRRWSDSPSSRSTSGSRRSTSKDRRG